MKINRVIDTAEVARQLVGAENHLAELHGVQPWNARIRALSKAITLVENDPLAAVHILAEPAFQNSLPKNPPWIIGLTGLPGAGKSSLINALLSHLRQQELRVAVFAIDPSSQDSGGAILGDRIRMQEHFRDSQVFIRSMGSRGALGGITHAARGAIQLARALPFDYVFVETVGIGQSESDIIELSDTTALVLMPNSGDDVQLMKAGIFQTCDVYVINKSDLASPDRMIEELKENAHLNAVSAGNSWTAEVCATNQNNRTSIEDLWQKILNHKNHCQSDPHFGFKKKEKVVSEILKISKDLLQPFLHQTLLSEFENQITAVTQGTSVSACVAKELVSKILLRSQ